MLKVIDINSGYYGRRVVNNISFTVEKGNNICIVGPNGCGKSTLLKSIANLINFDGQVLLNDTDICTYSRKELAKKLAIMFQSDTVYFPYTVYDTVSIGRYAYLNGFFSTLSDDDNHIVEESLKSVGIFNLKDKLISELSGGQLQRVFLARVFAQDPDVILLDEPTNHLDLSCQVETLEYLSKWCKENKKIVVSVLHDLNLVYYFSDHVLLMNNGKEVLSGCAKDVFNEQNLKEVYGIDIKTFMINCLKKWEG